MADARLGILIGADTRAAEEGLSRLNNSLGATESRMNRTGAAGQTFGKGLDRSSQSLKSFTTSSGNATSSLINLGRVVQDAPFGFIGIANNLNPLFEGFGRLRKETGSMGGAFKSLGKELAGAGGLSLAVSLVSSAFILFGGSLFGTSKAAKEAEESTKNLANSVASDVVKLTSLVAIATNVNKSYDERAKAIKAINQEYGKYLDSLEKEKVSASNVAESYQRILDALLRQAVVKGLQDEIEKAVSKTAASIINLEKTEEKRRLGLNKQTTEERKAKDTLSSLSDIYKEVNQTRTDGFIAQTRADQAMKGEIINALRYDVALKSLKDTLKKDLEPLFKIMSDFSFEDLKIKLDKGGEDQIDKMISKAKQLANELENVFVVPTFSAADSRESTIAKARKFLSDFFNANLEVIIPLKVQLKDVEFPPAAVKATANSFEDMFSKELKDFKLSVPIDFTLVDAVTLDKQKKQIGSIFGIRPTSDNPFTQMQRDAIFAAQAITDILTPAFQGLFSAIAEGTSPIKAFFGSLLDAVQQLISKLIAAVIQALILSAIFPGGLGGQKGFGQIFGALLGFRAAGGPVEAGKPYIVGEQGPELLVPRNSGTIIPNNRLNSISSAGFGRESVQVIPLFRGTNVDLLIKRTNKYMDTNV